MKECRPSVARNLDFCMNDPKWLSVQTESTVWTNTSAGWPKPASEPNSVCRCWSRVWEAHGWVVSWVRALKSRTVSGSRWLSTVGFTHPSPFSRKDWVKLCVTPRKMPGCPLRPIDLIRVKGGSQLRVGAWENKHTISRKRAGTQETTERSSTFEDMSKFLALNFSLTLYLAHLANTTFNHS